MNKILIVVLITLSVLYLSCKNNNLFDRTYNFKGKWLETTQLSDTLIFKQNKSEGWLELQRGREMRNAYILPLIHSGLYDYSILQDSISLLSGFSSCLCPRNYYFKFNLENEEIQIGNFFEDSLTNDKIFTFKKL